MPPQDSFAAKERIRQAVDIVELVGRYIPLRREGRMFKGLCPWHDDSRPSLTVNPDRQSYRCWVCNIGGDAFSFLMQIEGIEFPEALTRLAEQTGIALDSRVQVAGPSVATSEKERLLAVMAWAEQQYHNLLLTAPEAEVARRYLDDRGISDESIRRFHLGFAPPRWDWLLGRAQAAGHTPATLEAAGLASPRQNGSGHYDRFRGRVLFSIRNMQKRPVGLGGRVLPGLDDSNPAKYINSPETPLFSKSHLLYGLDIAREAISRSKKAVVVEGYTDCIMAHQCGHENVVAVLGTALGPSHVRLLRGLADQVVLVLDGDEAGRRRANEILELFVAEPIDLRILTLPENADPCEFLLARGSEAFATLLHEAADALEHKLSVAIAGLDARSGLHARHQAAEDVLGTLAKVPVLPAHEASGSRLREDQVLRRLARYSDVAEDRLRGRLAVLRRTVRQPKIDAGLRAAAAVGETGAATSAPLDPWQRELVEILLQRPDWLDEARSTIQPGELSADASGSVYQRMCELADAGITPTFDRLLLAFDQPQWKALIVELDEHSRENSDVDRAGAWRTLLDRYRQRKFAEQHRAETAVLRERKLDEDEEKELLRQIVERERSRRRPSLPTEG
ncbi:MAG: DNA primase [Pirellulales bacterium]|nr:DNA primase [Pirellulales bacterium]